MTNIPETKPEPVSIEIAEDLRTEVEKMIKNDVRMKGIARYLASIEIFWSRSISTACAGHGFIFFNPDFWNKLPSETRNTVVFHEVWHLILKHLERGVGFEPGTYNEASDHVINNIAEREGFTFEGTTPCLDHRYAKMSTEAVYDSIWKKKQENPNCKPVPSKHVPKELIEELVKLAANTTTGDENYANAGKAAADNTAKLEELEVSLGGQTGHAHIDLEMTNNRIAIKGYTYEQIFADYLIDPISGAKRSFMRPNRRMHGMKGTPFKLPGRVKRPTKKNRLAHLIYALDISGSINDWTRQMFHDSVRTIKELLNPALLTVIFFDTQIKLVKTFTDNQAYTKISVDAGGSTCLKAVYTYAERADPEAMVIFTDLCVIIPKKPKWHTIWLLPPNHHKKTVNTLYGDIYIIPPKTS